MMDIVSKFMEDFFNVVTKESCRIIRSEVDYVTGTIKKTIHDGIRDGFDAIRANIFYLFLAMGCTIISFVFIIWGLAKLFESYFEQPGLGFLVFGILLLLLGLFSFSKSKPTN